MLLENLERQEQTLASKVKARKSRYRERVSKASHEAVLGRFAAEKRTALAELEQNFQSEIAEVQHELGDCALTKQLVNSMESKMQAALQHKRAQLDQEQAQALASLNPSQ